MQSICENRVPKLYRSVHYMMLYHCQVMSLQVVMPPPHQRARDEGTNRIWEVKVAEAEVLSVVAPADPTVAVALALPTARPPPSPLQYFRKLWGRNRCCWSRNKWWLNSWKLKQSLVGNIFRFFESFFHEHSRHNSKIDQFWVVFEWSNKRFWKKSVSLALTIERYS